MVLPLVTSPYISRKLGASNIGIYSYTFTVTYYFTLVAMLGIKNYGNREISRCRDNKKQLNQTFSSIVFLHMIISLIVILAFGIYCIICETEYRLYYIIQSLYLFGNLFDISWFFFGLELFKVTVIRNVFIKILSVIFIFLFVKSPSDLWIYILILAVASFASQIYLWFKINTLVNIVKVPASDMLKHLPQMLILFIPTIAISLYNYMDKIMLGILAGKTELGFYENSFKITSVCSSVIGSVGTVMLPRMSNVIAKGNEEKSQKYIELSIISVMMMGVAMAFGLSGIANNFVPIFWGKEFTACGSLLSLLSCYLPIQAFASVLRTQYLIPNRLDKQYTLSLCVGAGCNLIFNWLLIPIYQAKGAVMGTIIAESSVCFVQAFYLRKCLPIRKYILESIPYLVMGGGMYLLIKYLNIFIYGNILSVVVQIVVGGFFYILCVVIYQLKIKKNAFFVNEALKLFHIKYRLDD